MGVHFALSHGEVAGPSNLAISDLLQQVQEVPRNSVLLVEFKNAFLRWALKMWKVRYNEKYQLYRE